jgi:hypothetical protein
MKSEKDKEIMREYARFMGLAFQEEHRKKARERYAKHPEYFAPLMKEWQANNRDKCNRSKNKCILKKLYGMTPEDRIEMSKKQGDVCKICGRPNSGNKGKYLHIDHNHVTGKVRGMLCNNCNTMLGMAKDDQFVLHNAIAYLQETSQEYRRAA